MNSCVPKVFGSITPPQFGIQRRRALVARADAVAPVVLVGEAAARPAHVGHLERLAAPRPRRCGCRACWGSANRGRPRCPRRCRGRDARRTGRRCCGRSSRPVFDASTDNLIGSAAMAEVVNIAAMTSAPTRTVSVLKYLLNCWVLRKVIVVPCVRQSSINEQQG